MNEGYRYFLDMQLLYYFDFFYIYIVVGGNFY